MGSGWTPTGPTQVFPSQDVFPTGKAFSETRNRRQPQRGLRSELLLYFSWLLKIYLLIFCPFNKVCFWLFIELRIVTIYISVYSYPKAARLACV